MTTIINNFAEWEANARRRIDELTESITAQEAERRELRRIIDYRKAHPDMQTTPNGKKLKDMTQAEKRDYNRIKAKLSRQRKKQITNNK